MLPRVRSRLKTGAWLASIAMLALALLPTVSRALAASSPASSASSALWAEVCTTQGVLMTTAPGAAMPAAGADANVGNDGNDGGQAAWSAGATALDRCAFCVLAAGAAPLAAVAPSFAVPAGVPELPRSFAPPAPHARMAWASAQPRAPPSHS